jgi:hypothetical protein
MVPYVGDAHVRCNAAKHTAVWNTHGYVVSEDGV